MFLLRQFKNHFIRALFKSSYFSGHILLFVPQTCASSIFFLFCFFSKQKVCFFVHTKMQSHFLLRHSFLQFFKGIVLVFHRSFVVRTFESCHLAFVTQMKPFFLGCLLSFDYFIWITFQNSKWYFTHTVGSSRFKLKLAK